MDRRVYWFCIVALGILLATLLAFACLSAGKSGAIIASMTLLAEG